MPRQIAISHQAERIILLLDTRGGSALIRVNGGVFQEVFPDPEARVVADIVDLVFNQIRKKTLGKVLRIVDGVPGRNSRPLTAPAGGFVMCQQDLPRTPRQAAAAQAAEPATILLSSQQGE